MAFAFLMQHVNFCLPLCVCVYTCVCAGTLAEFPVVNIRQLRVLQNYFSQLFSWQRCHTQIAYIAPSLSFFLSLSCALCLSCQKHTAKQVPALSPGQALPQVPLTGHKHVQININSGQEQEREEERDRRTWAWAWVMCLFVYFEVFAHYVELGHGCSRRISSSTRLGLRCELRCAVNMF